MAIIDRYLRQAQDQAAIAEGKAKGKLKEGETEPIWLDQNQLLPELKKLPTIILLADAIDLAEYRQLLKLTTIASQTEHVGQSQNVIDENARLHAAKLILAFGNYKNALAYLKRFEKANPKQKQLVHDACLFSLPSENYDIKLSAFSISKA